MLKKRKNNLLVKYAKKLGILNKKTFKVFPQDPNKPKRPANSYSLYLVDKREDYIKDHPEALMGGSGKCDRKMVARRECYHKSKI
eukprot:UN33274